jgi:hypothetical protein
MYPALDAVEEQLNDALALKANLTDPRLTDERTPLDDSVTSAKIVNGTIVNADVSDTAAIAYTKVTRPPLSNASDVAIDAGTLAGGQVIKYNAGTSNWVNGAAAGGVTASATAPTLATAAAGDAWFDTNDGTLYVCYVDVDSTKQWVQVQANSALEGSILSRLGALESQSIAYGTMSPNYVINGGFDIWQRGTSVALSTNAYSADRWIGNISGPTTVTQQTTGVPTGARYVARIAPTSTAQISNFYQIIETNNVAQLWGKTVTFSGKIRRNSSLTQNMAAVISKSSTVDANIASTWTSIGTFDLINSTVPTGTSSSSWLNFSVTATIPNDGTANTIYVGIFSGTVPSGGYYEVAQLQLEVGSVATPFRRNAPSIQGELAACQRYYEILVAPSSVTGAGFINSATQGYVHLPFKVSKRAVAAVTAVGTISGLTALWTGTANAASAFSSSGGTDGTWGVVTTSGLIAGQAIIFSTSSAVSIVANAEL